MIEKRVLYYFVKEAQEQVNKSEDRNSNTKRNVGIGAALLASALGGRYLLRNRKAIPTPPTVTTKIPDIPKPSTVFDGDLNKARANFSTRTLSQDYISTPYDQDFDRPSVIGDTYLKGTFKSPVRDRFFGEKNFNVAEGLPYDVDLPRGHSPRGMYLYDPDSDKTIYSKAIYGEEGTPSFRTDFRGRQIRSTFNASFPGNAEEFLSKVDEQKIEDALARLHTDPEILDLIEGTKKGVDPRRKLNALLRSKLDLKEIFGSS